MNINPGKIRQLLPNFANIHTLKYQSWIGRKGSLYFSNFLVNFFNKFFKTDLIRSQVKVELLNKLHLNFIYRTMSMKFNLAEQKVA